MPTQRRSRRAHPTPSIGGFPAGGPSPIHDQVAIPDMPHGPRPRKPFLNWLVNVLRHAVTDMGTETRSRWFVSPRVKHGPSRTETASALDAAIGRLARNPIWCPDLTEIGIANLPTYLQELRDDIRTRRKLDRELVEEVCRRIEAHQRGVPRPVPIGYRERDQTSKGMDRVAAHNRSAPTSHAAENEQRILSALRTAVAALGPGAKADAVVKHARVNRKKGRDGLRKLESLGQYGGFGRERPRRFTTNRSIVPER